MKDFFPWVELLMPDTCFSDNDSRWVVKAPHAQAIKEIQEILRLDA